MAILGPTVGFTSLWHIVMAAPSTLRHRGKHESVWDSLRKDGKTGKRKDKQNQCCFSIIPPSIFIVNSALLKVTLRLADHGELETK